MQGVSRCCGVQYGRKEVQAKAPAETTFMEVVASRPTWPYPFASRRAGLPPSGQGPLLLPIWQAGFLVTRTQGGPILGIKQDPH